MADTADVVDLTHRFPTRDEIASADEAATAFATARADNGALVMDRDAGEPVQLRPRLPT